MEGESRGDGDRVSRGKLPHPGTRRTAGPSRELPEQQQKRENPRHQRTPRRAAARAPQRRRRSPAAGAPRGPGVTQHYRVNETNASWISMLCLSTWYHVFKERQVAAPSTTADSKRTDAGLQNEHQGDQSRNAHV